MKCFKGELTLFSNEDRYTGVEKHTMNSFLAVCLLPLIKLEKVNLTVVSHI